MAIFRVIFDFRVVLTSEGYLPQKILRVEQNATDSSAVVCLVRKHPLGLAAVRIIDCKELEEKAPFEMIR